MSSFASISVPPLTSRAGRLVPRVQKMPSSVRMLLVYLAAITVIGKGPTYLGVPPLFWGEMVLVLLLGWLAVHVDVLSRPLSRLSALTIVIVMFMSLGAALTVKGFGEWRLEALRDAALWYYGLFYFVGLAITRYEWLADRVWKALTYIWVAALVWGSADLATKGALSSLGPMLPWRGVGLLSNTGSELGQNVALGAVILLSQYTLPDLRRPIVRIILALTGLTLFAASYGRGQKVAFGVAMVVSLLLTLGRRQPPTFARKLVCLLLIAAVLGIGLASLAHLPIATITKFDRFTNGDADSQSGTAYWRMIWWQHLESAVMTQNPAFGLGFGLNLCVYNPYLKGTEDLQWVARSPHNINMTIFSRMGLVGAGLWAGILLLGIGRLIVRAWDGSTGRQVYLPARREELIFWLVMLLTTWINSSFGVLMEGPVLGIWFWFALGFASGRSLEPGTGSLVQERRARLARIMARELASLSREFGVEPARS